jgi:4'-phosphopantetheinyl transferase EntD
LIKEDRMQDRHTGPQLSGLFPPGIEFGAARIGVGLSPRFPSEGEGVARAVATRRDEFLSGRELARELLAGLGSTPSPIPVGHRRTPIWPEGIVGSIAHSGTVCVCAVAKRSAFACVGIDLEPDEPLDDEVIPTICTLEELRQASAAPECGGGSSARLIFSAKECVFKTLFPITRTELEFHQVQLQWNPARSSFAATLRGVPEGVAEIGRRLRGAFRIAGGWLITAAWIEASARAT